MRQGKGLFEALKTSLERANCAVVSSALEKAYSGHVRFKREQFRVSFGRIEQPHGWLVTIDRSHPAGLAPKDTPTTRELLSSISEFVYSTHGITDVQWHKRQGYRKGDYSNVAHQPFESTESSDA